MHLTLAVLENFAEADQDGQGDAPQLQIPSQLLEIDAASRVLIRVHPYVPVLADREVALAPRRYVVQFGGFRGAPAVGRFAHWGGVGNFYGSHEFQCPSNRAPGAS